jgi:hypothetical protein
LLAPVRIACWSRWSGVSCGSLLTPLAARHFVRTRAVAAQWVPQTRSSRRWPAEIGVPSESTPEEALDSGGRAPHRACQDPAAGPERRRTASKGAWSRIRGLDAHHSRRAPQAPAGVARLGPTRSRCLSSDADRRDRRARRRRRGWSLSSPRPSKSSARGRGFCRTSRMSGSRG